MFDSNLLFSWSDLLADEFQKEYFSELLKNIDNEYNNFICFPEKKSIFAAFEKCNFNDLKVVIIGQDPYHGVGEANGLCFSVNDNVKIPPSLRNIFREINDDFEQILFPNSGNLERWASQGVLLLNNTLTVRKDLPNSHKHLDWNIFTNAVIQQVSDKNENIVFLFASDEAPDQIENFKTSHAYDFNYVKVENLEELSIMTLPTTYIVSPKGKLVFSEMGYRKWDDKQNIDLILNIVKAK